MKKFEHVLSEEGNWIVVDSASLSAQPGSYSCEIEARMKAIALSINALNDYIVAGKHRLLRRSVTN